MKTGFSHASRGAETCWSPLRHRSETRAAQNAAPRKDWRKSAPSPIRKEMQEQSMDWYSIV
ncbi:hypothetical protein, partial [Mesorhizobium sp. M8A.F.Ca.ET.182.01.1.1]|uniref:hypothetical protein n=1 Tax=Mesorhizobium sp. M8A.F.Ca.ET.182.01.1.1 TaxID=2563964 RepID=UPI001AEE85B8